jgi:hypothetical protein
MITRRNFCAGLAGMMAAPYVIRNSGVLMPVGQRLLPVADRLGPVMSDVVAMPDGGMGDYYAIKGYNENAYFLRERLYGESYDAQVIQPESEMVIIRCDASMWPELLPSLNGVERL